jgi:hypothetical protein
MTGELEFRQHHDRGLGRAEEKILRNALEIRADVDDLAVSCCFINGATR